MGCRIWTALVVCSLLGCARLETVEQTPEPVRAPDPVRVLQPETVEARDPLPPDLAPRKVHPRVGYGISDGLTPNSPDSLWAPFTSCITQVPIAVDFPAVSSDGQFVVHRQSDVEWDTTWVAYAEDEDERFDERYAKIERIDGSGEPIELWLLQGRKPPRDPNSGLAGPDEVRGRGLHCTRLRRALEPGLTRVNQVLSEYEWRAMSEPEELGVRFVKSPEHLQELIEAGRERSPIEFLARDNAFILQIEGVEVLHREPYEPEYAPEEVASEDCPAVLRDLRMDLSTGYTLVTVEEACYGDWWLSERAYSFTLSPAAVTNVIKRAASGRAILDAEPPL